MRNAGVRSAGMRCAGVPECRSAGVPECRSAGVPECRSAGVQNCEIALLHDFFFFSLLIVALVSVRDLSSAKVAILLRPEISGQTGQIALLYSNAYV